MTTKTTDDNPMLCLLNKPWIEYERHQRHEAVCRFFGFICYTAACIMLGVAFGMILCQ